MTFIFIKYINLILLLSLRLLGAESKASCATLAASQYTSNVCAGAVDYSFYLASNYTLAKYNTIARSLLGSTSLAILPVDCQIGLKKLVCANVYLKCPDGINLTSTSYSGWNLDIYKDILPQMLSLYYKNSSIVKSPYVPMPFMRPCKSVCTALASKCYGMLSLFGQSQDCNARYDYSKGALTSLYALFPTLPKPYQYDQRNTTGVCNAMTSSFTLAATSEPYLQKNNKNGACYGITTSLYVPPGPLLSSALAPMQQSYIVQTALESKLTTNFNALPLYMSQKCHLALKKYFCGSYMLAPSKQTFSVVMNNAGISYTVQDMLVAAGAFSKDLLAYSFYLPSYPNHEVCTDYATACAEFIVAANSSSLVPNCSAISSGIKKFPTTNQTINAIPLTISGTTYILKFTTPPNKMLSSTDSYETECPDGFVVPDKEDDRTKWVTGTGCAVACKIPLWTSKEWNVLESLNSICSWISLILISFILLTFLSDKVRRRHQYLVVCYAFYAMLNSLFSTIMGSMSFEDAFCATNAVPLDKTDGATMCAVQAVAGLFASHGAIVSWFMLCFDLFLKVALGMRHTSKLMPIYLFIIIVEPIIFLSYATTVKYGFMIILPGCMLSAPRNTDLAGMYEPLTVISCMGTALMLIILVRIVMSLIRTSGNNSSSSASEISQETLKKMSILKTPVAFLVGFLLITISILSPRVQLPYYYRQLLTSLEEYAVCAFKNFDGSTSWHDECGYHLDPRFPRLPAAWTMFIIASSGGLTALIYMINKSIWVSWAKKLGLSSGLLGVAPYSMKYQANGSVAEKRSSILPTKTPVKIVVTEKDNGKM